MDKDCSVPGPVDKAVGTGSFLEVVDKPCYDFEATSNAIVITPPKPSVMIMYSF